MSFGLRFRLHLNFPGKVAFILGVCQAILGILDIVLAVAGFVQKIWGHYLATGIWGGVVVFIDGLCGVLAGQTRTSLGVKTLFAVSLVSVLVTFVMIILSCGGLDFRSRFYDQVFFYAGQQSQATKAVHSALLALAVVEFVVSIINIMMCLKPTCFEKSPWTYNPSKAKHMDTHRPAIGERSDIPHGFMGGNPHNVPESQRPMIRKYRSPRRPLPSRPEAGDSETQETTEFLPAETQYFNQIQEEMNERDKKRHRQRSREAENSHDDTREKTNRGRMHGRRSNRRSSENDGDRYRSSKSSSHHPADTHSTVPRSSSQRCPDRENYVGERGKRHLQRNREGEIDRVLEHRHTSFLNERQPNGLSGLPYRGDLEGQHKYMGSHNRDRSNKCEDNEFLQSNHRNENQGLERSNSFQGRVSKDQHKRETRRPERRESLTDRDPGTYRRNSSKRRSLERGDSFRDSMSEQTGDRSKSLERSGSFRQNGNCIAERNQERPYVRMDQFNEAHASVTQNVDPHSNATDPNKQDYSLHTIKTLSQEPPLEPLRRSIGTRGSYSAAVNLMPTESLECLPSFSTTQNKPPTAFGEEELPAYEEALISGSLKHSTVFSRQKSEDGIQSDHATSSAMNSLGLHSGADEEVQEILGTNRRTPVNHHGRGEKSSGIPYMDEAQPEDNQVSVSTEVREKYDSYRRAVKPVEERACNQKSSNVPENQVVTAPEASFSLPSPRPESPRFLRGAPGRSSDMSPSCVSEDIPDIRMQKSFRASFPQRKGEVDRQPKRLGITPHIGQSNSPVNTLTSGSFEEDNPLSDLSASFPLLGAVGGVDFGISDQESYLQTPDSSAHTFTFDEVKPRVFNVSPYRYPRKSSPITGLSIPNLPSSEDEPENRTRVVETVNVGVASPPPFRRVEAKTHKNPSIIPGHGIFEVEHKGFNSLQTFRENKENNVQKKYVSSKKDVLPVEEYTSAHRRPDAQQGQSIRTPVPHNETAASRPKFFYPPERLPSRVSDAGNGPMTSPEMTSDLTRVNLERVPKPMMSGSAQRPFHSKLQPDAPSHLSVVQNLGSTRPEDANVAFYALHETLSKRTSWERQTFPQVMPEQRAPRESRPVNRTTGRATNRQVMRSEQAAQEEPLQRKSVGVSKRDARINSRRCALPSAAEPSPPLTGGPPPYSEVARPVLHRETESDRVTPQLPSYARQTQPSQHTQRSRRQPVFSLLL